MQAHYQLELSVQNPALRTFWSRWGECTELISPLLDPYDHDVNVQWGMQTVTLTSADWARQDDVRGWWNAFVTTLPNLGHDSMGSVNALQQATLVQAMTQSFGRITILIVNP